MTKCLSYKKSPNKGKRYFSHSVDGGLKKIVMLKRTDVDGGLAHITGANAAGQPIPLDVGYTMYLKKNKKSNPIYPTFGVLTVAWEASYELWFKGERVLSLCNRREQLIK